MKPILRVIGAVVLALVAVRGVRGQAAPAITSVSPASAYNYAPTAITITGTGFQSGATVKLGADTLTAGFVSSTTLTATVPSKVLAGPYDITVTNPGGASGSKAAAFTVRQSRNGGIGPWVAASLPTTVTAEKLILVREPYAYFWVSETTIARATIDANGTLSNWLSLPGPGAGGLVGQGDPVVTTDGTFIWLVRASDRSPTLPPATIDWATLGVDGSIGSWRHQSLPFFRGEFAFVAANGHLFAIGGSNAGFATNFAGPPMRAPIGVDGTPGTWQELTQLPAVPYAGPTSSVALVGGDSGAVRIGNHLFFAGRFDQRHTGGTTAVFRTTVAADGTLAAWQRVPDVFGTRIVFANGYLYTQVSRAELMADGSTGPWIATSSNGLRASSATHLYAVVGNSFLRAELSPLTLTGTTFAPVSGGLVTLTGTDFLEGSTVTIDGVPATNVVVSSLTQLTATIPAHPAGAPVVRITTPEGRTATSSSALIYDGTAPTGSIRINNDAPIAASRSVTLTMAATDDVSLPDSMAFSNDGTTFSDFEPFAATKPWTLPDNDGTRTVYVRFRDIAWNVSQSFTDEIVLDRRLPSGSVLINDAAISTVSPSVLVRVAAQPATSFTTVTDVSFSFDGITWGAWQAYATSPYSLTLLAGDGLKPVYARFRDSAGNVSLTVTDGIYLDTVVTPNTVSVNAGAVYANSDNVTLSLGAPGPAYTEMLISNDGGFSGAVWERYSSRRSWTLSGGAGANVVARVVYVRYRQSGAGAPSFTVQDDIIVDATPPNGSVTLSPSGTQLTLSASDDVSGVSEMAVSATLSFIGTAWEPLAATRAWAGGAPFVKFRDRAGNVSRVITTTGAQDPSAPFGSFDTPSDGTLAHGSLALGGWALDDRGVTAVRVFRDEVAGEAPGEVFIGNAVFVDGARPDVAGLFATLPSSSRGGWGLLVLTPVLPGGGTGSFTFSAYADDADGNSTLLGRRSVVLDNSTSTTPFGTIDTPAQGATISGSAYVNFGWVLTPRPKRVPTDGSTIMVYIDGQPVGHPTYNVRREDVAGTFPTLANAGGAIGYLVIDTTRYADGLHTIGWTVVDDAGAAEGVGSRYFRIQNGPALRAATTSASIAVPPVSTMLAQQEACSPGTRTGHDPAGEWEPLQEKDGVSALRTDSDRLELRFCAPFRSAYLVRDGKRHALPIGASLDPSNRVFAWAPGPAFRGEFEMAFEVEEANGPSTRRVTIRIER
jgi:hypothetical protein